MKTVFLQSLHIILEKKISIDASLNVSSGRKQYPCNYYIQHFKIKLDVSAGYGISQPKNDSIGVFGNT